MTRPEAVIFDMDGVVLDSEPIYRLCWRRAASDLGFSVSDELYARLIGRNNGDSEAIVKEELGARFPLEEFRQRWNAHFNDYVQSRNVPLKPGVLELLRYLDDNAIAKAMATSTEREKAIASLGEVGRRFDVMVTGDEIEHGKPAPDIFLRAANGLAVPPESCWVVEDSEPGVRAAHAAGMRAVIVPDLERPSPDVCSLAAWVCDSLGEVQRLLEKEMNQEEKT